MKNTLNWLNKIPVTDSERELIKTSIRNYARFAGLDISFEKLEGNHLSLTVAQNRFPTNQALSTEACKDRVIEIFNGIETVTLSVK